MTDDAIEDLDDSELENVRGLSFNNRVGLYALLAIFFYGFLMVDAALSHALREPSGLVLTHLAVAQLTLICIWGTLVDGTFWVRLPWTLLMLVVSWSAIVYGIYLHHGAQFNSTATAWALALGWSYGFIISYVPLKLAAWAFGWRIKHVRSEESETKKNFAIRDMMIGTTLLAVALAIGRAWLPGDFPTWTSVLRASGFNRIEPVIVVLIFSFVSLIVKLPCIWIALAAQKRALRLAIGWVFISGVIGFLEPLLVFTMFGGTRNVILELCFYLCVGHMAMAAAMLVVLGCLRQFGYSMTRRSRAKA